MFGKNKPVTVPNLLSKEKKSVLPKDIVIGNKTIQFIKLVDESISPVHCIKYLVKESNSGEFYTLKHLLIPEDELMEKIDKEVEIFKMFGGKDGIANFYGTNIQHPDKGSKIASLYVLLEVAVDTLDATVTKRFESKTYLTEGEIYSMFLDMCIGIDHLHGSEPPIIHRDIKLENVMVTEGRCKFTDFSHSSTTVYHLETQMDIKIAGLDIEKSTKVAYRSPEMCDLYSKKPIGKESDIWALGVNLYRMCYNKLPFEENKEITKKIMNGIWSVPEEPKYSNKMYELLRKVLVVDAVMRPDISELISLVKSAQKWHLEFVLKPLELKGLELKKSDSFKTTGETLKSPRDSSLKSFLSFTKKSGDGMTSPRSTEERSPRKDMDQSPREGKELKSETKVVQIAVGQPQLPEGVEMKQGPNITISVDVPRHGKPLPQVPPARSGLEKRKSHDRPLPKSPSSPNPDLVSKSPELTPETKLDQVVQEH